jgi:hypothetical protein
MTEGEAIKVAGIPGQSKIINDRNPVNCSVHTSIWDVKLEIGVHHPAEYRLSNSDYSYLCTCAAVKRCFSKPDEDPIEIAQIIVPVVPESSYPNFTKMLNQVVLCSATNCPNWRRQEDIRWDGDKSQVTFSEKPKSNDTLIGSVHG